MLYTLLASVAGFGSSLVPQLLKIFTQKQDNAHELALINARVATAKIIGSQKLAEVQISSDTSNSISSRDHDSSVVVKASQWVINLQSCVRPCLTFGFFFAFVGIKILIYFDPLNQAIPVLWDDSSQIVFAGIVSFWFGCRVASKR